MSKALHTYKQTVVYTETIRLFARVRNCTVLRHFNKTVAHNKYRVNKCTTIIMSYLYCLRV